MDSQRMHVMTLANSIIGVGILAMPYCFKQCGIVLSIVFLLLSSIISRLACHFLLKSAIKARLRTFEFLAFHAFGSIGKLIIEIGMIGFLVGTCIAFFVVMGDLGPQIVSEMTGVQITSTLRTSILMALALFCILPLGLLRNVDSLSGVCTATIAFYGCLVLKIVVDSFPHLLTGDWMEKVVLWRPAGILQCIPIFSMALFCQTQLFEIYQAIPNASLDKMNNLIRSAVNICTCVYIFVGTFGYIAVAHLPFTGNILLSLTPSIVTSTMKIGFVLSVAFSFPLVIFPCRASLHSLLFKNTLVIECKKLTEDLADDFMAYTLHEGNSNYIPEGKFKGLTFVIVLVSLITGVLIPNIELVLGLVGSTIGVMICVIFPATCFICLTQKNTNERILAQIMLCIGIVVMVLGTYANLYAFEEVSSQPLTEKNIPPIAIANLNIPAEEVNIKMPDAHEIGKIISSELAEEKVEKAIADVKQKEVENQKSVENVVVIKQEEIEAVKEVRHEPPQPEAPADEPEKQELKKDEAVPEKVPPNEPSSLEIKNINKELNNNENEVKEGLKNEEIGLKKADDVAVKNENTIQEVIKREKPVPLSGKIVLDDNLIKDVKIAPDNSLIDLKDHNLNSGLQVNNNKININEKQASKNNDEVDIEAIRKEDKEIMQQQMQEKQEVVKEAAVEEKKQEVIKIKEKEKESKKLLEDKEKAVKAIKAIEMIAKKAIGEIVRNITLKEEVNAEKNTLPSVEKNEQKTLPSVEKNEQNTLPSISFKEDKVEQQANVINNNIDDNNKNEAKNIEKKEKNDDNVVGIKAEEVNLNLNLNKNDIMGSIKKAVDGEIKSFANKQIEAIEDKIVNVEASPKTRNQGYDFQNLVPIPVVKSNNLQSIYAENMTNNLPEKSLLNTNIEKKEQKDNEMVVVNAQKQIDKKQDEKKDNIMTNNDEKENAVINKDDVKVSNNDLKDGKNKLPPLNLMQVLKGSNKPKADKDDKENANLLIKVNENKDDKETMAEDLKVLRRDILSSHDRVKREAEQAKVLKIRNAMNEAEFCDKRIVSPDRK